jgi:hypothetical protein
MCLLEHFTPCIDVVGEITNLILADPPRVVDSRLPPFGHDITLIGNINKLSTTPQARQVENNT